MLINNLVITTIEHPESTELAVLKILWKQFLDRDPDIIIIINFFLFLYRW